LLEGGVDILLLETISTRSTLKRAYAIAELEDTAAKKSR